MKHTGRHTGAFLLMFLTEGDCYGGQLLQKCQDEIPVNPIDSAIIYRTLKKLETEGAVESYFNTSGEKPTKMYRITETGERTLEDFHEDIESKIKNLSFFLGKYEEWKKGPQHD